MDAKKHIQRYSTLKAARTTWEAHWEEVARYTLPNKDNVRNFYTVKGEKKMAYVYDSTAIHSNELLASALHSMLTNPTSMWFGLTSGDPELDADDEVRAWAQMAAMKMHEVLNNSNFQTETHEVYLDLGSFGTACIRVEEDDEYTVRFHARPIAEHVIDENYKGLVDTVYRCYKQTIRSLIQEHGEKNLSQKMLELYKSQPDKEVDILHCVFPRDDYDNSVPTKYKYASVYIEKDQEHIISEGGFQEFPYAVPRWTKISGEVYGRSPAMKALPDIKMVNEMMKVTIRGAQKEVDPPLMAPDDGVTLPLNVNPGGFNYYRAGMENAIKPLQTGARVDFGMQMVDSVRTQIRSAFFIDQLQLNNGGPMMTATEVNQRTEERLRLMGPILGRQHFEYLRPVIERVYAIMIRKNLIPPAPMKLQNADIQVQYSSQIAKVQRISETDNLLRAFNILAPIIQLDPNSSDNLDTDKAFKFVMRQFGVPETVLRNKSDIDMIREHKAEQMAQAQQQQEESHAAELLAKGGKGMESMAKSGAPLPEE